ncbi:hypothetical protein Mc24_04625 [Thermotoga sp. Mc24]|nr:hypothetical protein Mc24_04625 [Thermotoga sp. Mc24]
MKSDIILTIANANPPKTIVEKIKEYVMTPNKASNNSVFLKINEKKKNGNNHNRLLSKAEIEKVKKFPRNVSLKNLSLKNFPAIFLNFIAHLFLQFKNLLNHFFEKYRLASS